LGHFVSLFCKKKLDLGLCGLGWDLNRCLPAQALDHCGGPRYSKQKIFLQEFSGEVSVVHYHSDCWCHTYLSLHSAWQLIRICSVTPLGSSFDVDNRGTLHHPGGSCKRNLCKHVKF